MEIRGELGHHAARRDFNGVGPQQRDGERMHALHQLLVFCGDRNEFGQPALELDVFLAQALQLVGRQRGDRTFVVRHRQLRRQLGIIAEEFRMQLQVGGNNARLGSVIEQGGGHARCTSKRVGSEQGRMRATATLAPVSVRWTGPRFNSGFGWRVQMPSI